MAELRARLNRILSIAVLGLSWLCLAVTVGSTHAHASDGFLSFEHMAATEAVATPCGYAVAVNETLHLPEFANIYREDVENSCKSDRGCKTFIVTASGQCSPIFYSNQNLRISRIFGHMLQRKYDFGLDLKVPFAGISSEANGRQLLIVIQNDTFFMF